MKNKKRASNAARVSTEEKPDKDNYFHVVREQLQFWPYTIHQIDDTLDAGLIEARAKQLLFRAIHSRNLTTFVGSGLSMSYGRLNWRDWEKEQRRTVDSLTKSFKELSDEALRLLDFLVLLLTPKLNESDDAREKDIATTAFYQELHRTEGEGPLLIQRHKHNVWQWMRGRERAIRAAKERVNRLHLTFDLTKEGEGHFPGGEEMPVKFEIAQQLHNELRRHMNLFLPNDLVPPAKDTEASRNVWSGWPGAAYKPRTDAPARGLDEFHKVLFGENGKPGHIGKLGKLANELEIAGENKDKKSRYLNYKSKLDRFWHLNQRPEAQLSFEELSKTLLVDECPHAAILLRKGLLKNRDRDDVRDQVDRRLVELEKKLGVFEHGNQRRDIQGIRQDAQRYRVLSPFLFNRTRELIDVADRTNNSKLPWSEYLQSVQSELNDYLERSNKAGVKRNYLTPSSRYLVPLALSLLKEPFKQLGVDEEGELEACTVKEKVESGEISDVKVTANDSRHPFGPPEIDRFISRRSILANRFDPMPKIHRDLKVERFITTNYDFEIERYFQDIGYSEFDPVSLDEIISKGEGHEVSDRAMRRDQSGRVLRDTSFHPERAAELTSFALAEKGVHVFHLHGRATRHDRLVITERDYMRLYLSDDKHRSTIDESIKVAFSGAPLLFLGLGMEETDLLRPLRQFISNRDRTIGYTSMALLPADKGLAARTKFAASLYMRYGVHTIFYGSGQVTYQPVGATQVQDASDKRPKQYAIDWLYRIVQLCSGLRDEVRKWEKLELPESRGAADILKDLIERVGGIDEDMADGDGYKAKDSALLVLLNLTQIDRGNEKDAKSLIELYAAELKKVDRHKKQVKNTEFDSRILQLRNCDFAPTRPSPYRSAHRREAETRVSAEKYLGFYTAQLDRLLTMVLNLPEVVRDNHTQELEGAKIKAKKAFEEANWPEEKQRIEKEYLNKLNDLCAPIHIALDGLQGAFITGSLNAALDGIGQEKRAWWKSWQDSPHHRRPEFQRLPPRDSQVNELLKTPAWFKRWQKTPHTHKNEVADDFVDLGTKFLRHKLDNVLTPLKEANERSANEPLLEGQSARRLTEANRTHVRAFDTFVAAVSCTFQHRRPNAYPNGRPYIEEEENFVRYEEMRRQLITVAARRGMGKGTFMSAFVSNLGGETYKKAAWPQDNVFFAGSVHINLGFSSEIASTYDMLISALVGLIAELKCKTQHKYINSLLAQQCERENLTKTHARLSREMALQSLFGEFSRQAGAYKQKNGEQPRLLLNICAADLLFDRNGISKNREINNFMTLLFSDELRSCPVDIVFLADDEKLGFPWSEAEGTAAKPRLYLDRKGLDLFADQQIARALKVSNINMDETTEDRNKRLDQTVRSMPMAGRKDDDDKEGAPDVEPHFIHFTRPVNTAWLLIDNFPVLAMALHLLNPPRGGDLSDASEWFSDAVRDGRVESDNKMDEAWSRPVLPEMTAIADIRDDVHKKAAQKVQVAIIEHAKSLDEQDGPKDSDETDVQLKSALRLRLYSKVNERDAQQWREIRRGLGNSRFSLTLLLAAAQNVVVHSAMPHEAATEAERLLLDTVARLRPLGHERRDQMVLETVLETYRGFHQIGHADLDCDLHLLLIKHLGVIGTPVGSAVLVRLSDVRKYFRRIGIETETSRRRFIVRALTTMANRGLVFRLDPHPRLVALFKEGDWPADQEYRYALHRVVQSFTMDNLEAGPIEPVSTNRFAPTLYAAMPSQGPTLARKSYQFLRTLIIGLSQYPDIPADDDTAKPWLFTTKDHSIRVQAARAAVSLARSNFSVAVISRLAVQEPIGTGVQRRGHLETYRVRLRWLVRIAYELSLSELGVKAEKDEKVKEKGVEADVKKAVTPEGPHDRVNVLYRDEIVWLYNELGVIALAQGALSDALGYFRQAAEANERVEGLMRSAPIYNHIDLNHAIVQIERGQFASASRRLREVREANSDRKLRLYHIAEGYLCVLDHLQGEREGLERRFRRVTSVLQRTGEDRAAALFLMHHARFVAKGNFDVSKDLIARARNLAETAGHEDVRQHVELTAIRLRLSETGAAGVDLTDQKILGQVEIFSRRMAIWSLSVDALWVRANILLAQNENIEAGRLLTRAMGIAKRHSMTLRLNSCLTTYAKALLQRGDIDGAFEIANQSLDLAKRMSYALETGRAQSILRECKLSSGENG